MTGHQNDAGKGPALPPADCMSKEDIRAQIDRLDAALLALFRERFDYVDRMVAIKQAEGLPGFIPDRVEAVAGNVRNEAVKQGLDGPLFEGLWRDLMAWNIAYEDGRLGTQSSDDGETGQ